MLGWAGVLPIPMPARELSHLLAQLCGQPPLHFPQGGPELVASVGIVTGGAPSAFDEAVAAGLDAFVTGEAREWVQQRALEDGVHYFAAGHYATERFGVRLASESFWPSDSASMCGFSSCRTRCDRAAAADSPATRRATPMGAGRRHAGENPIWRIVIPMS